MSAKAIPSLQESHDRLLEACRKAQRYLNRNAMVWHLEQAIQQAEQANQQRAAARAELDQMAREALE